MGEKLKRARRDQPRKITVEDRNRWWHRDAAWNVKWQGTAKSAADALEEHPALARLARAVDRVDAATASGRRVEDAFEELWAANEDPMVGRARRRAAKEERRNGAMRQPKRKKGRSAT